MRRQKDVVIIVKHEMVSGQINVHLLEKQQPLISSKCRISGNEDSPIHRYI